MVPSGWKSKHSGSDRCRTTTSDRPPSPRTRISPAVQSENHNRPSCQRGDSTRPKPVAECLHADHGARRADECRRHAP